MRIMRLRRSLASLGLLLVSACGIAASAADEVKATFQETRRFDAPEAHQGVASDGEYFYAIGNFVLGKYRATNGERVAQWQGVEGKPLIHMNAGIVWRRQLYTAHSNYPGVPNVSSVEIWNPKDLTHVGTHSFGRADGSLTWVERRNNRWIACFVHYGKKGGEPGRGPEWTRIVEFDDEWRQTGGWALPPKLVEKIGVRGYSCSGGAMGPRGYLYVTGHDDPALYVLKFPEAGPFLEWVGTIAIPTQGQAFGWDPKAEGTIYLAGRERHEVIVGKVVFDSPEPAKK